jgi:hypothetical protein
MNALFLIAALALPSGKMQASMDTRVRLVQMLSAFTSEYTNDKQSRILVVSESWQMVSIMRRKKFNAYGLASIRTRSKYVVLGLAILAPFSESSFRLIVHDDSLPSIQGLLMMSLREMDRVLVHGGFLFTPSEQNDLTHYFLSQLKYRRIGLTFEGLAVFQKSGTARRYWGQSA